MRYNKHLHNFLKQISVDSNLKLPFQEYFMNFIKCYHLDDLANIYGYFLWLESQYKYYRKSLKENPNMSFEQYQEEILKALDINIE